MNTLFDIEPVLPEGFLYVPRFLSEAEEMDLLSFVTTLELRQFVFQGFEAKRRYASFGVDYSFSNGQLTPGEKIPQQFNRLLEKVKTHLEIEDEIAELLVLEYPHGSVINWHRDAPPFDTIIGVSLLSDCIFKLRPHEKSRQNRKSTISFNVKRRSLYLMRGAARSEWQHSTAPVKHQRYSITLRTLR